MPARPPSSGAGGYPEISGGIILEPPKRGSANSHRNSQIHHRPMDCPFTPDLQQFRTLHCRPQDSVSTPSKHLE